MGGEAARGDDHVVALLPQAGGADPADLPPDVVPVEIVPLQHSQGRHVLVENINLEVALGLHTGGHQASLGTQLQHLNTRVSQSQCESYGNYLETSHSLSGMDTNLETNFSLEMFIMSVERCISDRLELKLQNSSNILLLSLQGGGGRGNSGPLYQQKSVPPD